MTDLDLLLLRKGEKKSKGKSRPAVVTTDEKERKEEGSILCAHCRQTVTMEKYRQEIDGAHQHTFFNPAGIVFEIGCFTQANGCMAAGPPSTEFSWFKGFAWRYVLCSGCFTHLGWLFESSQSSFHGLILKRLLG